MNSVNQAMIYDANKKSIAAAYLLWFFLGGLGMHRFYVGKTVTAIILLALTVIGSVVVGIDIGRIPPIGGEAFRPTLVSATIGAILLAIAFAWVLIDAVLIPRWVRGKNALLAAALPASGIPPQQQ